MKLLDKQLSIDFATTIEPRNTFSCAPVSDAMNIYAKTDTYLVIYNTHLYVRSTNQSFLNDMIRIYGNQSNEWFGIERNLEHLRATFKAHNLTMTNYFPLFILNKPVEDADSDAIHLIEQEQITTYKEHPLVSECFCFDEKNPDIFGFSYIENDQIIGLIGCNKTGKQTIEIGLKVDEHRRGKGIATQLLNKICHKIQTDYPDYLCTYTTQFTHTTSMNLAISNGFKLAYVGIAANHLKENNNR
ncbi:hypothetical protein IGI37_001394 [Enterococcus sp. AZ194]|uniref:GNAT family N-acetyltransferase n=1 Tax=Enterococcus sp. AZ194 TaxID=2774629 RepID=UPI003F237EA3